MLSQKIKIKEKKKVLTFLYVCFKEVKFTKKTPKNCLIVFKHLIASYNEVDNVTKKGKLTSISLSTLMSKVVTRKTFPEMMDLNPELLYLVSIASPKELHSFFVEFYANFDQNKNFCID